MNRLGVSLRVITGDNKLVAAYIVRALDLDLAPEQIVTGGQMQSAKGKELTDLVQKGILFCEVDPDQKQVVIRELQKAKNVVGFMGDGINDVPSLEVADVSISVDNAVDVAKSAAQFVMLKDDLAVIEKAIVLGRGTVVNTFKYIMLVVSNNFGNMFSVAGASLLLPFLPMQPKQ